MNNEQNEEVWTKSVHRALIDAFNGHNNMSN